MGNTLLEKAFNYVESLDLCAVAMVGLKGAGITTLLNKIKLGELEKQRPVPGLVVKIVRFKSLKLISWEANMNAVMKPLQDGYFEKAHAAIFVVDCTDRAKIEESRVPLEELIKDERFKGTPLLILCNKQDLANPLSAPEVGNILNVEQIDNNEELDRKYFVIQCSAVTGDGLEEGFNWLITAVNKIRVGGANLE